MRLEGSRHRGKKLEQPGRELAEGVSGLGEVCFDSDGSFCLISEKPNVYS